MVNPEYIGSNHTDAAHLHFDELVLPSRIGHSGKMKLPAHAKEWLFIFFHVIVGEGQLCSVRTLSMEILPQGIDIFFFKIL